MKESIDLEMRPDTYFSPPEFELELLRKVKNEVLREKIRALFAEGRHGEVIELVELANSARDRKALERFHPMYMAGNYLPELEDDEVEIARVILQSVLLDVASVYAKPSSARIDYKVVDDNGSTWGEMVSEKTLTLGELADFLFASWPILDHLKSCYGDDLDGCLRFISGESDFYWRFDDVCRQRVIERFAAND